MTNHPNRGKEPVEGWWFADASGVLPHGDGRPIVLGESYSVKGRLIICQNGLHGSRSPLDALLYATGPIIYRTRHSGEIIERSDELCSRIRVHVAKRDSTAALRLFARKMALSVIHLWDAPQIVRDFLETGDETLRDAARAAARGARDAAWGAQAAAWAAGWDAAWDAAWAAARGAARAAAWAAGWDAAWDAVRAAAWAAGWDAAWDAAEQTLLDLFLELFQQP